MNQQFTSVEDVNRSQSVQTSFCVPEQTNLQILEEEMKRKNKEIEEMKNIIVKLNTATKPNSSSHVCKKCSKTFEVPNYYRNPEKIVICWDCQEKEKDKKCRVCGIPSKYNYCWNHRQNYNPPTYRGNQGHNPNFERNMWIAREHSD